MQRNSRTISKTKQKIRIIHIFAPEIIKTDAANFRELVQRLTGKPEKTKGLRKKDARILPSSKEGFWMSGNSGGDEFLGGFDEINHFQFLEGVAGKRGFEH
ncbi:hypothetical protein SASPL_129531 [Salvia splendens]|uniref:VQ domain-containing protein n=1 Tax=Salvia splendens TaxID=180675 RepID=A0A8X8ZPI4_SALSN|nr:hypothetical protein SASPL_129531 [Salvia splendens]